MARTKKNTETPVEKKGTDAVVAQETKVEKPKGHVFYTVMSKTRGGFVTEHMDSEKACETVDAFYFEQRRKIGTGQWNPRPFDMYILKRDTGIAHTHSQLYHYIPGSLSEARREAKMRERYGDDYRDNRESEDIDNFDASKYM